MVIFRVQIGGGRFLEHVRLLEILRYIFLVEKYLFAIFAKTNFHGKQQIL